MHLHMTERIAQFLTAAAQDPTAPLTAPTPPPAWGTLATAGLKDDIANVDYRLTVSPLAGQPQFFGLP